MYLAHSVGGVVAVFFAEFPRKIKGTDDKLWIVVGDLRSAYLVVEPDDSPAAALERYRGLMEDWIAAVRDGADLSNAYLVSDRKSIKPRKRGSFCAKGEPKRGDVQYHSHNERRCSMRRKRRFFVEIHDLRPVADEHGSGNIFAGRDGYAHSAEPSIEAD